MSDSQTDQGQYSGNCLEDNFERRGCFHNLLTGQRGKEAAEPPTPQVFGEVENAAEYAEQSQGNQDRLHETRRRVRFPLRPSEYEIDQPKRVNGSDKRGQKAQEEEPSVKSPPFQPDGGQNGVLAEKPPREGKPRQTGPTGKKRPEGDRQASSEAPHFEDILLMVRRRNDASSPQEEERLEEGVDQEVKGGGG